MKHIMSLCFAALALLLTGCATVIRSDVTVFNEWPLDLPDKSFVFAQTAEQNNNLEYRNYENLVGTELQRLGFNQATDAAIASLNVTLNYDVTARDVHAVEPVLSTPMWYGPYSWARPGFYSPFYDPFWSGPQVIGQREFTYQLFQRRLNIVIARAGNGQKLYDVTVISKGKTALLPAVMPYLVRSAFADFPGKNGVPRQVELKVKDKQ